MVLHDHQPIDNFDEVMAEGCAKSYIPFFEIMGEYPELRISLHVSGCLLEWMKANSPATFEKIGQLARAGRIEIIGGGFYEPIMTMLPKRDRVGQVRRFSEYLEREFGQKVRGAWVAERVWEQPLVSSYAEAGIGYVVLDDFHFKNAGLEEKELDGAYVTEDEGNVIRVFASDERLRYSIPFANPEKTIEILKSASELRENALLVYGDDGEKFGMWPETHKHVYVNGWLKRFLDLLMRNRDWIRIVTLADAADGLVPRGKIYLPDASYREMTEWALPWQSLLEYEKARKVITSQDWSRKALQFMRGGTWRNFKVKYPEANRLYAKMMHVSRFVNEMPPDAPNREEAIAELYRGQCNCTYWHGVFGGLYMPHLRRSAYTHLLKAETLAGRAGEGIGCEIRDFDSDGRDEVFAHNDLLGLYVKPDQGGRIYELDFYPRCANLANALTRRPEAYHAKLKDAVVVTDKDKVATIHDLVRAKEADLDKKLVYDSYSRDSMLERLLPGDARVEDADKNALRDEGSFVSRGFRSEVSRKKRKISVTLTSEDAPGAPDLVKKMDMTTGKSRLDFTYHLSGARPGSMLAIEFNITLSAGDAWGRYCYTDRALPLGNLAAVYDLPAAELFGMVDEWQGIRVEFIPSAPIRIWMHPIKTISQSEEGFELVYQSSVVTLLTPTGADGSANLAFAIQLEEYAAR